MIEKQGYVLWHLSVKDVLIHLYVTDLDLHLPSNITLFVLTLSPTSVSALTPRSICRLSLLSGHDRPQMLHCEQSTDHLISPDTMDFRTTGMMDIC